MEHPTRDRPRATLMILDGARPDVFDRLREAGDLPNIERHLLAGGPPCRAVTVFPSTTGVAYLPMLTGCFPGTCDIPGIRWLDVREFRGRWWRAGDGLRSYCGYQGGLLNEDVRPGILSLFDLVDDSVALCTPFHRGLAAGRVRVRGSRMVWGSIGHYTGHWRRLERAIGSELAAVARARPRLAFAVFPGVDCVTHRRDPFHPDVLRVYREFDGAIGRFAAAGGFEGDSLVIVASDHGAARVERHTDVALALEAAGVPTLRHPVVWRRAPRAAVMVSGNGSAQVYLRPGEPRGRRIAPDEIERGDVEGIPADLVQRLADLPGVALVAAREGEAVRVTSREGRASVAADGEGGIRYSPETADVLGLGGAATGSGRAWLQASIDGAYPDAPVQLLQLFRSRRAGDLVVAAGPGTDLRSDWEIPEHRAGHGSLTADHMRCVVAANRPLPSPIRTADIFPVILDHLGVPVPGSIDGTLPPASATMARSPADASA
jgi:hypothetical protein